jgi:hypothetical protein
MKPSLSLALVLLMILGTFTSAFVPIFDSKPFNPLEPEARANFDRVHGLEITAITQWVTADAIEDHKQFRVAVFKDVHVAWDPYIQLRGYFDAKALGVGTTLFEHKYLSLRMPYIGSWLVMWVASGTVSPEGAVDIKMKLYDLPGFEFGEAYLDGMLYDSEAGIMDQDTYRSITVHLEPYETYKAVPLGMGGTLELFVLRSNLIPVSALVPDVDPTELEWGLEHLSKIGDVVSGDFDMIKDIVELHVDEWTEDIEVPWD